jgi:two-component system sensor histidine kinase BaeS
MISPIRHKITLIILAVSLGGILISGLLIHYSLNRKFQDYLLGNERIRQEQIVRLLSELYTEYGGWSNLPPQFGFRRVNNLRRLRFVLDDQGQMVLLVRRGMMPPPPGLPNLDALTARPIKVYGRTVGTAYFGKTILEDLLTRQDRIFRNTVNQSILAAMLLTGLLSVVIAYCFANRFSAPITEMNQIASAMTAGQLNRRVRELPRDELGELGANLNHLAERLKESGELRQKLTADVAHDLRTPLATVRSHLEGMIDRVIPASPENLESLLEEVKRLTSLVEDLQEINRADLDLHNFKPEALELRGFLEHLVAQRSPLFREKNLKLALAPGPPAVIRTDRAALAKIFDNLLSNAYKYTPSGRAVALTLTALPGAVRIDVSDQGIGIAAADLPYIFERFYRTDQSRNRESGGFGLGLTIVKELVEAMAGTVTVRSVPGEGSVFTVNLPSEWRGAHAKTDRELL